MDSELVMLVSTRGRYAIRIMLELSSHSKDDRVSLAELSRNQEISLKYAEAIVASLVKSGLLEGQRGKNGGYSLVKSPSEISIGEILQITEDSLAPVACMDCIPNNCPKKKKCRTLPMWENLGKMISDYLYGISLEDLMNGNIKSISE